LRYNYFVVLPQQLHLISHTRGEGRILPGRIKGIAYYLV